MTSDQVVSPGAVIGILGGGQLGLMLTLAARRMGYRIAVLDPAGAESPAGQIAEWAGSLTDEADIKAFTRRVFVVTLEWENVPVNLVERLIAQNIPVRPGVYALATSQDRFREKNFALKSRVWPTRFRPIGSERDLLMAKDCTELFPGILKKCRDGYDGKGQVSVESFGGLECAWKDLKYESCILEERMNIKCELSVIVARRPGDQELVAYGPFENEHENGILRTSRYPAGSSREVSEKAVRAAKKLAVALDVHGLLAVEFFVKENGELLFNEIAPRPHNSGHLTIECAETSQFELAIRAICNLPWGNVGLHSAGEMRNIIGDEVNGWEADVASASPKTCRIGPEEFLHLYGKREVRPGRKMGHIVRRRPPDEHFQGLGSTR